jgi:hypothetical protein
MTEKIWDLMPDGGGPPVQIIVGNPSEAIAAHPERYTRQAPDGTAQAALAKVDIDKAAARAAIEQKKRDKLAAIGKEQSEKLAAIDKEQAEARTAALAKQREEAAKKAEESGEVPSREGEKAAIEAEAAAAAELAQHEADQELAALEAGAPYTEPAAPVTASETDAERAARLRSPPAETEAERQRRLAAETRAGGTRA